MILIQSKIFRSTKGTDFQNSKMTVFKTKRGFYFHGRLFLLWNWKSTQVIQSLKRSTPRAALILFRTPEIFLCKWTAGWTSVLAGILAVTIAMLTASGRTGQWEPRDFRCELEPLGATMHEYSRGSWGLWSRSVRKKISSTNQGCDVLIPIVTWKADLRGGSSSSFFNSSSSSSSLSVSNK